MDKWFKFLAEERASVAGLRKSMSDLLDKGPHNDGSPFDDKDDEKPRLKGKKSRNQVSAPPGAPGGGSVGASGPSLEEEVEPETFEKNDKLFLVIFLYSFLRNVAILSIMLDISFSKFCA